MNSQTFISKPSAADTWGAACRPTALFVVAFALNATPHEAVHAITGYLLGIDSTLFQLWVNPDSAEATSKQLAIIAAAGPVFSLAVGIVCLALYQRRFRRRPSGVMWLMMALVGIYFFLGPMVGAALGGDFHIALTTLDTPKIVAYVVSAIGLALLPSFMFFMGGELLRWAPSDFGRVEAVACTTVGPWLIGTLLVLLVYWPLPGFLISSTIGGTVFWVFAVMGAARGFSLRRSDEITPPSFTRADLILSIVALAMVRLLVHGIHLHH